MKFEMIDGIPTVTAQDVQSEIGKTLIVDVRRPDEYTGVLGHIETAQLVTLGPDLEAFLQKQNSQEPIIFVCHVGGRSARATEYAQSIGIKNAYNMKGRMTMWSQLNLPITK